MKCPKLFFFLKIINNIDKIYYCFVPVPRQNEKLDEVFKNEEHLKANFDIYNQYTKAFISNEGEISNIFGGVKYYASNNYSYSAKDNMFNFEEIAIVTPEETNKELWKESKNFNAEQNYNLIGFNKGNNVKLLTTIKEKYPVPNISNGFYVDEKTWNILVRNILKKINTILIGPTGVGKTELVMMIAKALNLECNVYDMGSMIDPLTDLLGSHRLNNGNSEFDYAKFTYDIQKPGIILLDELSRAPLSSNNILFPCLDSRRSLPIEIADSKHDRSIKVHDECVFIATANIGVEYSGTNEIDAALLNRFIPMKLNYLPQNIECEVLMIRTGIDKTSAMKIIKIVNEIRALYMKNEISKSVSTRESIACADMVVDGFSIVDSIDNIICNKFASSGFEYDEEINQIKKIIIRY